MGAIDLRVYVIGSSKVNEEGMKAWLADIAEGYDYDEKKASTDAENIIGHAGKRCYRSFTLEGNANLTQVRSDWVKYFDNILSSGHGSVLEHATYTFGIEGISRVCTGELNRHRAGVAISEGSMRYIRLNEDIDFWMPAMIQGTDDIRKALTRDIFIEEFRHQAEIYGQLCKIWDINNQTMHQKKKLTSMFRRIIGMGVATGGVWTFNIRELRHILELRTSSGAEEEIALMVGMMGAAIIDREPLLFGDYTVENGIYTPKYHKV